VPHLLILLFFCCFLLFPSPFLLAQSGHAPASKTLRAVRASEPPRIDGKLDDPVWQTAPVFSGFTQREPDQGAPASESTTVRFLYDDEALYVGFMLYDREPEKIVARLTRRDVFSNSDRVSVDLNPHHDHQTGAWFGVNAAGVQDDGLFFNDTEYDFAWDGVWTAKTVILSDGWSVEYRIPYHVLRFGSKPVYTWGINLIRDIGRRNEKAYWIMIPRNETGWVSRMAHLEGIEGIRPPSAFEVTPYSTTQSKLEPKTPANPDGRGFQASGGADIRYGLTSNLSLNATINPDFGQVEADSAVLNLSTFETFFEERRPFFVEGTGIFKTPIQLFYSRRIGRQPGHIPLPTNVTLIDRPEFTTIGAAFKLTGKTASKTTFGLISALTPSEYATITDSASAPHRRTRIEPLTHALVGRIQQDIGATSNAGLLATALNRRTGEAAYTGGVDWNIRWKNSMYEFSGQMAGSRTGLGNAVQQGLATQVKFAKTSGWFLLTANGHIYSPGFSPNDLGFLERANQINPWGDISIQKTTPFGPFRTFRASLEGFTAWNFRYHWNGNTYRRVNLFRGFGTSGEIEWKNFWKTEWGVFQTVASLDDRETRGGPLFLYPPINIFFLGVETNGRYPVNGKVEGEYGYHNRGTSWWNVQGQLTIRPASNLKFSFHPRYDDLTYFAQWITNVDDNHDGTDDHFVFGRLRGHTLDLTTRANITFTPTLSLQFYLQPFVTVGRYTAVHELARPSSYEFTPYTGLTFNPDFNNRSLRSNLVLRWEYRPGSTVFLVWSQSRSAASNDSEFRPLQSLRRAFRDEGTNVFLIKLNYWLNM